MFTCDIATPQVVLQKGGGANFHSINWGTVLCTVVKTLTLTKMNGCLSLVDEPVSYHKSEDLKFSEHIKTSKERELNGEGESQYTITHCSYRCGYTNERASVEKHERDLCQMRPYKCQYCQYEATYQDVTELHQRTCLRFPVQCPYSCGAEMTRYDLVSHIEKECSLVPGECQFSWAGCNQGPLTRSELSSHAQSHHIQHLSLLTEACSGLARDNKELREKHEKLQKSNSDLLLVCNQLYSVVTGSLPSLPIKLAFNEMTELDKSAYFYSSRFGYKMSMEYHRSAMIESSSSLLERDIMYDKLELTVHSGVFDNQLDWPFNRNVTISCVIRHNDASLCLKLVLSRADSSDPKTLFLSPVPLVDPEEDKERFLVHVVYTGDTSPWYCESVEILSID